MVDIQSVTAEIRRGKKDRKIERKIEEETTVQKNIYNCLLLLHRATIIRAITWDGTML